MPRFMTRCLLSLAFLACAAIAFAPATGADKADKPDKKKDKKTDTKKKDKKTKDKKGKPGETTPNETKPDEMKVDDTKKAGAAFVDVFNGKDLTGFKTNLGDAAADPNATFKVRDGVIVVSGTPNGYFYTDRPYKNYVLTFDWRYERPAGLTSDAEFNGNSGCLVHIQEPHKVWPKCVEVQGMNKDHGKILFVGGSKGTDTYERSARDKAVKPVGEWNTTEIVCEPSGHIVAKINGVQVSSGKGDLTEGLIGFQSEGAEIHFRNIKIRENK